MKFNRAKVFHVVFALFIGIFASCAGRGPISEARELIKNKEYKKAIRFLRETSRDVSPFEQDELNILLGMAYISTRKYGKAKDILFSLSPQKDALKKMLALSLVELGDSARAIGYRKMAKESYEIALLNYPDIGLGKRYLLLIRESYNMGDCDLVVKFSSNYIQETHDTSAVFTRYVDCLYQKGNWYAIDSLKVYFIKHRRIRDMGWALGEAIYNIAIERLSEERLNKAKGLLMELVNEVHSPRVLLDDAYFLLGGVYDELQMPDSAMDMYYKCMQFSLTPRSPLYKESVVKVRELKDEMGLN